MSGTQSWISTILSVDCSKTNAIYHSLPNRINVSSLNFRRNKLRNTITVDVLLVLASPDNESIRAYQNLLTIIIPIIRRWICQVVNYRLIIGRTKWRYKTTAKSITLRPVSTLIPIDKKSVRLRICQNLRSNVFCLDKWHRTTSFHS